MVLRSEVVHAYRESRSAVGKRVDPAAWLQERLEKQLARKLERIRRSGYGAGWFEEWYAAKKAKKTHVGTLISYLGDLVFFRDDPAKLSIVEIILRLSDLSTKTRSAERYRRVCVTIKTIVKHLQGRDEADKIPIPPHGKPRVEVLSPEDIREMLAACDNPRDRLIIEFFLAAR
jgi:integrase